MESTMIVGKVEDAAVSYNTDCHLCKTALTTENAKPGVGVVVWRGAGLPRETLPPEAQRIRH